MDIIRPAIMEQSILPKKRHMLFTEAVIFFVIMFCSSFAEAFVSDIIMLFTAKGKLPTESVGFLSASDYKYVILLAVTVIPIVLSVLYCTKAEKRSIFTMGITKKDIFTEYIKGFLIGAVMLTCAILLGIITKTVSVTYDEFSVNVSAVALFAVCFIVQGASEEILLRGYLMTTVSNGRPVIVAAAFNSVIFAILHMTNDNVGIIALLNIFLFGFFLSLLFAQNGNIYIVAACHTAWNFFQGNIFGINVSGIAPLPSVFFGYCDSENTLVSGGAFGIEGGLLTTIITVIGISVLLFREYNRQRQKNIK